MTAKADLQHRIREHVRLHGVIAGWRVWEACGPLNSDAERQIVYGWVCEVLHPCGDGMKPLTMWIERSDVEVEVGR